MVQLTRMSITDCQMITEVIARAGEELDDDIIFRQLKSLELVCLPNLLHFCSGNYTFQFPSLEKVSVRNCLKMKVFSQGGLITTSMQKVEFAQDKELWDGNLNTTMGEIFIQMNIPNSEED
ncbi:hypothetical protein PTKIN_Ptkin06aG0124400 [Pterospermum kingtungense]